MYIYIYICIYIYIYICVAKVGWHPEGPTKMAALLRRAGHIGIARLSVHVNRVPIKHQPQSVSFWKHLSLKGASATKLLYMSNFSIESKCSHILP